MTRYFTRRQLLRTSVGIVGLAAWQKAGIRLLAKDDITKPDSFRFVHLTDIHIQPELRAADGLAACLEAINHLTPRPDFIVTGGDLIMDALAQTQERSEMLYDLLKSTLASHTDLPVWHCIGNHDVFGWAKMHGVTEEHPQYGKRMYCEKLQLDSTYYSFDHKGWRFFILDTIQPSDRYVYEGGLNEEQREWLEKSLANKPLEMPAVVVGHIPFLTVTILPETPKDGQFQIPSPNVCRGGQSVAWLFSRYNVKLVLSGHIHMVDEVNYRGVKFVCGGAVSGGWWKGPNRGFEEGFGIVDLYANGQVRYTYYDYDWKTE